MWEGEGVKDGDEVKVGKWKEGAEGEERPKSLGRQWVEERSEEGDMGLRPGTNGRIAMGSIDPTWKANESCRGQDTCQKWRGQENRKK